MVVIVVVLSSVIATSLTAVVFRAEEKLERQATGTYEFEVQDDDKLHISPENLDTNNARLGLQINGNPVYEWDGQETLEITCLYPGDEILVTSKKDGVTSVVDRWKMVESTKCKRLSKLTNKFKYAFIDQGASSKKAQIAPGIPFTLKINPDGPGADGGSSRDYHKRNISKVSLANEWHFFKRYKTGVGPFDEGPVWLMIMVDNVHWKEGTNYDSYNWTDDPPTGTNPGKSAYKLEAGAVKPVNSNVGGPNTEPTNDIYLLFRPRCASEAPYSELAVVGVFAGYSNDIWLNGDKVIDSTAKPKYDFDDDDKPEEILKVPPRDC